MREIAQAALTGLGYRVITADSGLAALQIWEAHRHEIELLLTDLVMPGGITGRDLALRLRASEPRLPVVYMSGYSYEVAGDDVFDCLPRSVKGPWLTHKVHQALEQTRWKKSPGGLLLSAHALSYLRGRGQA